MLTTRASFTLFPWLLCYYRDVSAGVEKKSLPLNFQSYEPSVVLLCAVNYTEERSQLTSFYLWFGKGTFDITDKRSCSITFGFAMIWFCPFTFDFIRFMALKSHSVTLRATDRSNMFFCIACIAPLSQRRAAPSAQMFCVTTAFTLSSQAVPWHRVTVLTGSECVCPSASCIDQLFSDSVGDTLVSAAY